MIVYEVYEEHPFDGARSVLDVFLYKDSAEAYISSVKNKEVGIREIKVNSIVPQAAEYCFKCNNKDTSSCSKSFKKAKDEFECNLFNLKKELKDESNT